ncbi:MAG TPA: zinc ribbon domain-containing protein [Clostridiales bacterium]|nr:zinc ribbon domain-containing protein [Clostridiales bacterium]
MEAAKYCQYCGSQREEWSKFCPACGASLETGKASIVEPKTQGSKTNTDNVTVTKDEQRGLGIIFMIGGWISVALSLWVIPILFVGFALILGNLYRKYNKTHGMIIMIAAIGGLVIRFLIVLVGLQIFSQIKA